MSTFANNRCPIAPAVLALYGLLSAIYGIQAGSDDSGRRSARRICPLLGGEPGTILLFGLGLAGLGYSGATGDGEEVVTGSQPELTARVNV